MKLDFSKFSVVQERKFQAMNNQDKYRYLLSIFRGMPYGWGEEHPEAADCSGSVCFALMGAFRYKIRTTANGLYQNVFLSEPNGTDAVFFLTKKPRKHGSRIVPEGTVTHVAGYVDDGIILNAEEPVSRIRSADSTIRWFQARGFDAVVKGLSHSVAGILSGQGTAFYGVDPEIKELFNL